MRVWDILLAHGSLVQECSSVQRQRGLSPHFPLYRTGREVNLEKGEGVALPNPEGSRQILPQTRLPHACHEILGGIAYIARMNPGWRYQAPSVQWSAKPFKPVQYFTALWAGLPASSLRRSRPGPCLAGVWCRRAVA
jgi:hypothetical protein